MRNPFKIFYPRATHFDIPFEAEHISRVLPSMIALMLYIMTMIWAGGVLVSGMSNKWQSNLEGSLTVQISPPTDMPENDQQAAIQKVKETLLQTKGIVRVTVMPSKDILATLEPWLGKDFSFEGLPKPVLIGVSISEPVDTLQLTHVLKNIVPYVIVSDHSFWLVRAHLFSSLIKVGFILFGILFMIVFALMIMYGVHSSLSAHRDVVHVLHTVGAHDQYIIDQFVSYIVRVVARASIVGFMFSLATIAILLGGVFLKGIAIGGGVTILVKGFGWLLLLPLSTVLVAWITSSRCVRSRLVSYYM